ncbi:MAG: hypothetical protein K5873_05395 [Treponema sp.]|nr:hypothetical protein [Treponema sp.]
MKHFIFLFSAFLLLSCSSAPKRVMLVNDNTNLAYSQLEEANNSIITGAYIRSYNLLTSSYNLALSVDNTELLCKILLSGIVYKISSPGEYDYLMEEKQSFLCLPKEEILASAKMLAGCSASREILLDLSSIYDVRIQLENEKLTSGGEISSDNMKSYVSIIEGAEKSLAKEAYYKAYLYRTKGDVYMACRKYDQAGINYEEAAKIHTKERYLLEIGLDYYCLARSHSLAGRKIEALAAIERALKYDKDGENTSGIASDYLAYSKILLKGNPGPEEVKAAEEYALWSEKILNSRKNEEKTSGQGEKMSSTSGGE